MVESETHSTQSVEAVAKLNDDVEFIRIGCNILAKENRDSSERLGSLEKTIASSNSEVNHKIGTLERQLLMISSTLARIEANSFNDPERGKGIATSSDMPSQVTNSTLISEQTDAQLGYRGIHEVLANREKILNKNKMPVFSGRFPFDWICRVERFFSFGRYTDMEKLECVSLGFDESVRHWFSEEMEKAPFSDWSQFTDRLLDRFAGSIDSEPVSEISSVADYGQDCSQFMDRLIARFASDSTEVVFKKEQVPVVHDEKDRNTIVHEMDELPLEFHDELVLKKESAPAIVHESSGDCVSFRVKDKVELQSVEKFSTRMTSMQKNEFSDQLQSQSGFVLDGLHTDFGSDDLGVCQGDGFYRFQVQKEDGLALKSPYLRTKISAYKVFDALPITTEKQNRTMLQVQSQDKNDHFLMQKRVEVSLLNIMRRKLIGGGLKQNMIVIGEFKLKHKWRYKLIQPIFELHLFLNSVVITIGDEIYWDYMDNMIAAVLLFQELMVQPKQKQTKSFKIWAFKYKNMNLQGVMLRMYKLSATVLKAEELLLFQVQNSEENTPYIRMTPTVDMRGGIAFTVDSLVILTLMEEQCKKQQSTNKNWMFKYKEKTKVIVGKGQHVLQQLFCWCWRLRNYNTPALEAETAAEMIFESSEAAKQFLAELEKASSDTEDEGDDSAAMIYEEVMRLGMMAKGYVWIATTWLSSLLDSDLPHVRFKKKGTLRHNGCTKCCRRLRGTLRFIPKCVLLQACRSFLNKFLSTAWGQAVFEGRGIDRH